MGEPTVHTHASLDKLLTNLLLIFVPSGSDAHRVHLICIRPTEKSVNEDCKV